MSDLPAACRSLTCVIVIHAKARSMYCCLKKQSYTSYVLLRNREPLRVLNDLKLVFRHQGGHSDSFKINMESFRTFRGLLFLITIRDDSYSLNNFLFKKAGELLFK